MKTHTLLIVTCFVMCLFSGSSKAVESAKPSKSQVDVLVQKLIDLSGQYYPKAVVSHADGKLSIKHGTMLFTVHGRSKTGEVYPETHQEEGPNFKGFILTLHVESGRYEGAANIPQTINYPYWKTYIDRPMLPGGQQHYVINFAYGSRLDPKFMQAIFETLPNSWPQ